MSLKCGIVGLPNVGKSTLFNALTQKATAEAANFPFCTIEPNVSKVAVPDERLEKLAKIADSKVILPVQIEFVDIAGLVKGASKGEGLGNKFLSHIREVDAIINVVRCFENDNIVHVEKDGIDPIRDIEIIQTELILADLESLEKRIPALEKKTKNNADKETKIQLELIKKAIVLLSEGQPASAVKLSDDEEKRIFKMLQLITAKPQLYVCNLSESEVVGGNRFSEAVEELGRKNNYIVLKISAQVEAEIVELESEAERLEFLSSLGLKETGLSQIIRSAYQLLELITFFTVGPKECHGWMLRKNYTAPKAAGEIHTDFEKGFIRAETISYADYIQYNGEEGCKNAGKLRLEGKDYVVADGDIFHFRFNV